MAHGGSNKGTVLSLIVLVINLTLMMSGTFHEHSHHIRDVGAQQRTEGGSIRRRGARGSYDGNVNKLDAQTTASPTSDDTTTLIQTATTTDAHPTDSAIDVTTASAQAAVASIKVGVSGTTVQLVPTGPFNNTFIITLGRDAGRVAHTSDQAKTVFPGASIFWAYDGKDVDQTQIEQWQEEGYLNKTMPDNKYVTLQLVFSRQNYD